MKAASPKSVGLGGDGDEIVAIGDVEDAFGITLDHGDAGKWRTAGDVYATLCKALPPAEADQPGTWERFRTALALESGVDPKEIDPDSPLLASSGPWGYWLLAALAVAAMLAGAVLR